jgi:hypothetical protein
MSSPLFSIGEWDVHHAGIAWPERESHCNSVVEATLLLALQPTNPQSPPRECPTCRPVATVVLEEDRSHRVAETVSMLKIEVIEDDVVRNGLLPAPVRSMPVEIVDCEAVGRWSQEQLTLGDDGNQVFIRIDPSYHEEDKGIYFVRLHLRHHLEIRLSPRWFDFRRQSLRDGSPKLLAWLRSRREYRQ